MKEKKKIVSLYLAEEFHKKIKHDAIDQEMNLSEYVTRSLGFMEKFERLMDELKVREGEPERFDLLKFIYSEMTGKELGEDDDL